MEDEITKRELSDDELDNVSGGGCEENALLLHQLNQTPADGFIQLQVPHLPSL